MSHLLAIAVGPVQEFIAAARRTRDLWFGSYLLSEISKAVAMSVKDQGGRLIFPHPDTDLTPENDKVNVANVILTELPAGVPRDVAAKAKQAAQQRWHKCAIEAHCEASGVIRQDIWDDQVTDVIEFYAAWVASSADYRADRGTLMRLLAGRKSCRDFLPAKGRAGVPKSSLDGQRETVLKVGDRANWPRRLRLSKGEQLDVVGITKRLGKKAGESHPTYSSVARIAAESWLHGKRSHSKFSEFKSACGEVPGLNRVAEQAFGYLPFEGTLVFKDRHPDLVDELGPEAKQKLEAVAKLLKELGGEPNPYLAVLVADGDKMGAAISALDSPKANREFSNTLAGFADSARAIVTKHNGVLVYAGGDDVLAFLPVDKCLGCARELHDDFGERLKEYGKPTLSVGIAIGHFMENLEDLLDYGRKAEKEAKKVRVKKKNPEEYDEKDALAVHLHKRGGAPIMIASRWDPRDEEDDSRQPDELKPDFRLNKFANLMNKGIIPTKLAYELRAMANLYEPWAENADTAIQQDLYRLIAKKTSRGSGTVRQALSEFIREMTSGKLMTLARELLVARQIATALRQAAGQSFAAEEVTA